MTVKLLNVSLFTILIGWKYPIFQKCAKTDGDIHRRTKRYNTLCIRPRVVKSETADFSRTHKHVLWQLLVSLV